MRPITQMCHPIIMNNLSIGSTNSNNNNSNNTSFLATTLNETSSSATKTANLFRSRSLRESITRV